MPVEMIPKLDPSRISDAGERVVYEALRDQLPSDWAIRYHYTYCAPDGQYQRDGETDFIVIAPGKGLMFLEVKQSHGYDCRNGLWYRVKRDGREEPADNPFNQAMRNMHRVVQDILGPAMRLGTDGFPGIFGHAVVFPFGKVQGRLPASQAQAPVLMIAYRDMDNLHDRLNRAFDAWGGARQAAKFTPAVRDLVVNLLSDESRFVAVAAAGVDEDDARIERLSRQQFNAFRGVLGNPRARVEGRAGSGKTLLALWAANSFGGQGKKVLFLCFNRVLAAWLNAKYPHHRRIDVRSFHVLCREYAAEAEIPFHPPDEDPEEAKVFWAERSPTILDQAVTKLGDNFRYDAVIVDEAQDFHQDWWLAVQLLLKDPDEGPLYLFYDPDQAGVYGHGQAWPADINFKFELLENCRNTRRIASYCGRVIDKNIPSLESAPEGISPQLEEALPDVGERAVRAKQIIQEWFDEGFRPARIALLSPWKKGNPASTLTELSKVGAVMIESNSDQITRWIENAAVWGSTVKSFKDITKGTRSV